VVFKEQSPNNLMLLKRFKPKKLSQEMAGGRTKGVVISKDVTMKI